MEHLLFATYLILFSWLITKIPFFKKSGLTPAQLVIFFLVKVIAGIIYGWVGVYYGEMAQMVDTWAFHYKGLETSQLLQTNPKGFFAYLFANNYGGYGNFLASYNSWWNDLHNNSFIMLISFFDVLSFGNYYINVIFFSFITFFGPLVLYRLMIDVFPKRGLPVLLTCVLLPSFLYWTSGIHKDGIVFVAFMLIIYHVYFGLKERFSVLRILYILLGVLLLLIIRNFLLVIIAPAILVWIIAARNKRPTMIFVSAYLFFFVMFFTAPHIHSSLDFTQAVVGKQADFKTLQGGSFVPTENLQPKLSSFVKNAPQAFALSTLRPYPSDAKHLLALAASVEINVLLLCFLVFLFLRKKDPIDKPLILFFIFFSFSVLFVIGYTVNFIGAIVRYRSIVLPFIVVPIIALIDWKRLLGFVTNKY